MPGILKVSNVIWSVPISRKSARKSILELFLTSLFLSFSNAKGKGTMRIALIDFKEFRTKKNAAEARNVQVVEIPIQLGEEPRAQHRGHPSRA